jgi:hypothetical protein
MGKARRLIRPGKPEALTLGNNLMPGYIITVQPPIDSRIFRFRFFFLRRKSCFTYL